MYLVYVLSLIIGESWLYPLQKSGVLIIGPLGNLFIGSLGSLKAQIPQTSGDSKLTSNPI